MTLTKLSVVTLLTVSLISSAALAGAPLEGVYNSTDMGGDVELGRYMEAYAVPEGAVLPGTTLHAQSWDGMNLGQQWSYQCGVMNSTPVVISDFVGVTGTGSRTYMKTFEGGTIWLSGTGPWGNGEAEYTGPILNYVEYETVQFVNFERVHAVTNVSATAYIEAFPNLCLAFTVGNGVEIGSTDFDHPVPADYPMMHDADCNPADMLGAWWDFMTLSLYIDSCVVSTDEATWDTVKSFYR